MSREPHAIRTEFAAGPLILGSGSNASPTLLHPDMQRLSFLAAASLVPAVLAAQATSQSVQHATEIVPAPATTLPLKHAPQPTTPAITAADLMTRLYIFADDSMQGREAGTIGNVKGTDYIASEVK